MLHTAEESQSINTKHAFVFSFSPRVGMKKNEAFLSCQVEKVKGRVSSRNVAQQLS